MILIKFNWTVKKGNGIRLFKNVKEEKQKGGDERERERKGWPMAVSSSKMQENVK